MQQHLYNSLQNWQFESFAALPGIQHLVTGKNPHIHAGIVDGFNFSRNQEYPEQLLLNKKHIAEILQHPGQHVIIPKQTHNDHIGIVTSETIQQEWEDTDALITNIPDVVIGVLAADCVPVLLADPVKGVVAAIHAGWRGTVKEIVPKTIHQMMALFHCDPADIIAGIGPSISSACYEVGGEVSAHFRDSSKSEQTNGKYCVDLWEENNTQLLNAGITHQHISISGLCTFSHPDLFYSARREGLQTGRMAAFIALAKP